MPRAPGCPPLGAPTLLSASLSHKQTLGRTPSPDVRMDRVWKPGGGPPEDTFSPREKVGDASCSGMRGYVTPNQPARAPPCVGTPDFDRLTGLTPSPAPNRNCNEGRRSTTVDNVEFDNHEGQKRGQKLMDQCGLGLHLVDPNIQGVPGFFQRCLAARVSLSYYITYSPAIDERKLTLS